MTLRVGDEEVVFTLPNAMKHTLDHDDPLYFTDETNMVNSDYVQELLAINPLDQYLELESKEVKKKISTPPPMQQLNQVEMNSSPCGKKKKKLEENKEKSK